MPRYDFRCLKCKRVQEISRSIHDESPVLCCEEGCDGIEMEQLIGSAPVHFKGLGWAAEGYSKTGID